MGQPLIYQCHAGIVDVAVPILINDHYIGMILTGQVVLSEEDMQTLPKRNVYPPIDFTKYPEILKKREQFFNTFRRMTLKQIQAYSNLLFTIANYIAEIGYKKLIEQELNQQRLQLAEEEKAKAVLKKNMVKYELKSIQAQLNPSFLLNTFNSIQRQAILEDANITSDLLLSFASILRRSLKLKDSLTTIRDELKYINDYTILRNISSHKKIVFETDIDESCLTHEIPVFTLQPFIENVLINNWKTDNLDCHISLVVKSDEEIIRFNLSNRNLVINHETTQEILNTQSSKNKSMSVTTLNIKNVVDILIEYYGSRFTWKFLSSEQEGTTIQLSIPRYNL